MSKPTDSDRVAELAADIVELIGKRDVLLAEGTLALFLAIDYQASNCGCKGCKCGDNALKRATKELREDVGSAAIRLFDLELEARGY